MSTWSALSFPCSWRFGSNTSLLAEASGRLVGSDFSGIKNLILLIYSHRTALLQLPVSEKTLCSFFSALQLSMLGSIEVYGNGKRTCICFRKEKKKHFEPLKKVGGKKIWKIQKNFFFFWFISLINLFFNSCILDALFKMIKQHNHSKDRGLYFLVFSSKSKYKTYPTQSWHFYHPRLHNDFECFLERYTTDHQGARFSFDSVEDVRKLTRYICLYVWATRWRQRQACLVICPLKFTLVH